MESKSIPLGLYLIASSNTHNVKQMRQIPTRYQIGAQYGGIPQPLFSSRLLTLYFVHVFKIHCLDMVPVCHKHPHIQTNTLEPIKQCPQTKVFHFCWIRNLSSTFIDGIIHWFQFSNLMFHSHIQRQNFLWRHVLSIRINSNAHHITDNCHDIYTYGRVK